MPGQKGVANLLFLPAYMAAKRVSHGSRTRDGLLKDSKGVLRKGKKDNARVSTADHRMMVYFVYMQGHEYWGSKVLELVADDQIWLVGCSTDHSSCRL